ncbi:MAG TPA: HAMP domain-containing sensor histidine kinase [Candidatus Binatia bacterium]|nr:HAMP domain-containing sensor histidine kinase [Candidatus Binatia bacterium]
MRLAWRVFLSTSLVILVLVGIAAWSLRAVNRFVHVNATIVERTVPALRLETSLRQSLASLVRLEGRWGVLHDARYAALWTARAERATGDLARLSALLTHPEEVRFHRKSTTALATYRELALDEPPTEPARALALARQTRLAAARAEAAFERLTDATAKALERSQHDTRTLEQRTWNAVATALPLAVLAGFAGAALVALGMTRALRRLSVAASEIAEGRFPGPVPVAGEDEIGRLGDAFNRMAEELGEVDRLKREFFADISHELRTPLTAVREGTNLLRDQIPGPLTPKQARLVDIIRASAERVLRLVDQILELSRLQAGLVAFERRSVDVERVVGQAMEELRPQAEARGLTLVANGTRPAGAVVGDEARLVQALVNLMSNAIKFTPAGGTVRVETVDRGEAVEIAVEDTGIGIPPDALAHVFERYWQEDGTRGGSGLGLAIVKGIVQAHGGEVGAESRAGVGSRFAMRLPRRGAPA